MWTLTAPFQNLPRERDRLCLGRDVELASLQELLLRTRRLPGEPLRVACLYGMHGVGKTHVALEYAHRHIKEYGAVLWITAETALKLQQSFGDVARSVGLGDDSVQHPDQLWKLVRRHILGSGKRGKFPRRLLNIDFLDCGFRVDSESYN